MPIIPHVETRSWSKGWTDYQPGLRQRVLIHTFGSSCVFLSPFLLLEKGADPGNATCSLQAYERWCNQPEGQPQKYSWGPTMSGKQQRTLEPKGPHRWEVERSVASVNKDVTVICDLGSPSVNFWAEGQKEGEGCLWSGSRRAAATPCGERWGKPEGTGPG